MKNSPTVHDTKSAAETSWQAWVGLVLLIVASVLGNLWWTVQNTVLVGRDSTGHLERSVKMAQTLAGGWPQALFNAITLTDYRPPALYLATQPFYWLFGRSMDSAQLVNVVLHAAILLLTFLLARRLMASGAALLAVLLTALLPMMAAMTRLYYSENLLTMTLLVSLWALLESQGFSRRGWSLLWGATLGGALLVKWTAPIYIVLPLLVICWREGLLGGEWALLRPGRIDVKRLGAAVVIAALAVLAWSWPNRGAFADFVLGNWIMLLWLLVWSAFVYLALSPTRRNTNLWVALLLAATIASLWYFPRIDFVTRLTDVAFGTDRGNQESFNPLRLDNYVRYFGYLITDHMGWLAALLILPPALWVWLRRWPERRTAPLTTQLFWLMLASAYLFLMVLAQSNPRNLVPLMPVLAILLVDTLRSWRRPIALVLAALWVSVLAVQWSIYTFDALRPFYQSSARLWAASDYLTWPASGFTDPGYWIQPDVLDAVGGTPDAPATLGILVDSWELHRGSFRYLIAAQQRPVELATLTEPEGKGWSDMLANQWILLKDGDNSGVREPGLSVLNRILAGDEFFDQLYRVVNRYPLPNGETATLYHRTDGPPRPGEFPVVLIETSKVADAIGQWWSEGATLVFTSADTAVWVGIHDLPARHVILPRTPDEPIDQLLGAATGTIFVVSRYDTPQVQDYLHRSSYYAADAGDGEFHLSVVGRPDQALSKLSVQTSWPDLRVTALRSQAQTRPGAVLPLDLTLAGRTDGTLKLSVRLIGADGQAVAQKDVVAEAQVAAALLVPPDAPAGSYMLGVVVYDPATMEPMLDAKGNQLGELSVIQVMAP